MKWLVFAAMIALIACGQPAEQTKAKSEEDMAHQVDSIRQKLKENSTDYASSEKTYANAKFKDVKVIKSGDHQYTVTGKGQFFEATFGWVVEDGHNELKQGHQMTDAGAPEFGNFKFTIDVQKEEANSTLTLILFESSPKDGSRQDELPLVLE